MQKLVIVFLLLVLVGCSTMIDNKSVQVAPKVSWIIQPASLMNHIADQTVVLTAIHNGETHKMLVSTESQKNVFVMVAMSTQGVPLFELVLDESGHITNKTYLPLPVNPQFILSDMQLISLPVDQVKKHLKGMDVAVEISSDNKKRTISVEQSTIIDINYQHNKTQFIHYQRGYELLIEVLR